MLFISIMMAFVWFNFSALRVECIFSPKKLSPFCSCFLFISFVRFSTGGSIYSFSVCPTTHSRPIITLYSFELFCHSLLLIVIFALYRFYPIRRDNRNFVLLRALESSLFICYFCSICCCCIFHFNSRLFTLMSSFCSFTPLPSFQQPPAEGIEWILKRYTPISLESRSDKWKAFVRYFSIYSLTGEYIVCANIHFHPLFSGKARVLVNM